MTTLEKRLWLELLEEQRLLSNYLGMARLNGMGFEARTRDVNVKKFNKKIRELKARIKKSAGDHK